MTFVGDQLIVRDTHKLQSVPVSHAEQLGHIFFPYVSEPVIMRNSRNGASLHALCVASHKLKQLLR